MKRTEACQVPGFLNPQLSPEDRSCLDTCANGAPHSAHIRCQDRSRQARTQAHTKKNARTHTHTQRHTHTGTHTHIHKHKDTHKHIHTQTLTHVHPRAHARTYTHSHAHPCRASCVQLECQKQSCKNILDILINFVIGLRQSQWGFAEKEAQDEATEPLSSRFQNSQRLRGQPTLASKTLLSQHTL